ncbi:MAG: hypothetical protein H7842_09060 [Gammaproteobacteria bacterium SHHR-1]|uniref:hypothetical protein n=1 Tax=Magnetovirga frankeli TaxID=947516 RepID=UPI0012933D3F|nr:hypothetical protein D5125_12230 [gamma proteobacterium SS-5]
MSLRLSPLLLLLGLTGLFGLVGCGQDVDSPFFNYMDCRAKKRASLEQQGMDPTAADMRSKAYCKERFPEQP